MAKPAKKAKIEEGEIVATQTTQRPVDQIATSNRNTKKWWKVLVILICLLAVGGLFYWQAHRAKLDHDKLSGHIDELNKTVDQLNKDKDQLQKDKNNLSDQLNAAPALVVIDRKDNIKAAMDSGNTAVLGTYMAGSVDYVIAASEGKGTVTPTKAVNQITSYFKDALPPWNFSLDDTTLKGYKNGTYKSYLTDDTYFGESKDGMFIAFHQNDSGQIDQVFMAASVDLLQ